MSSSKLLDRLIEALQVMPGIGPVSATRIAYHLLDHARDGGLKLSDLLREGLEHIALCPDCRNYTDAEGQSCAICSDFHRRNKGVICVVETPQDVEAFERSGGFDGIYFVLHGHLSPIDGIGPNELGLSILAQRLKDDGIQELILALSQGVEGEATAQYIAAIAKNHQVRVSRIATGVPIGGDLRNIDSSTLATSLRFRRNL